MVRNMDFSPQATGRGWRVSNSRGALSDLYKALGALSVENGLWRGQGENGRKDQLRAWCRLGQR